MTLDLGEQVSSQFLHVVVPGVAPPSPRPRATMMPLHNAATIIQKARRATSTRDVMTMFRPQIYMGRTTDSEKWKGRAKDLIREAMLAASLEKLELPVEIFVLVVGPLAASQWRKRTVVPRRWQLSARAGDFDNLVKPICDAATGVLWKDDRQVVSASVEKIVGAQGEDARLEFIARPCWGSPDRTRFEKERDALQGSTT